MLVVAASSLSSPGTGVGWVRAAAYSSFRWDSVQSQTVVDSMSIRITLPAQSPQLHHRHHLLFIMVVNMIVDRPHSLRHPSSPSSSLLRFLFPLAILPTDALQIRPRFCLATTVTATVSAMKRTITIAAAINPSSPTKTPMKPSPKRPWPYIDLLNARTHWSACSVT